jgi:BRCT domain type II-containing protein
MRKNELTKTIVVAEVMEAGADSKPLKGKSFSISGHLGKKREDVVALIVQAGGRFDKTPAWGTTYLITNADWSGDRSSSRKFEAAKRNGTRIISEVQFLEMLMKEPPVAG